MISKKQKQNIILIMIVLLGLFLAYSLRIIFSAILGAVILYTLFRNLYIKLVVEKKWRNIFAFIFIAISTFTIIILPFFTLSWMVIDKLSYFNSNPKYIQDLISHLSGISGIDLNHSSILETVIKNIETWALGSFPTLVNALLKQLTAQNKKIAAYGAAAKGVTFLNFCGIDGSVIDYIIDLNPNKQNKFMPGSNIPIKSKEFFLKNHL